MDSLREAAAEYFACKTGLQQRLPARQRDASARSPEDFFEFSAKVFSNGTASIDVIMQNRQSISYRGELDTENKK